MKLFRFLEFINEAVSDRKHWMERVNQRIEQTLVVDIDSSSAKRLREKEISIKQVLNQISELIALEFKRRTEKLQSQDFVDPYIIVVLLEPILKIGSDRSPITMTVTSWNEDNPEIRKSYSGEKLCVYINHNEIRTVKVMPSSMKKEDLELDAESHIKREFDSNARAVAIGMESGQFVLDVSRDGKVQPYDSLGLKTVGKINTGEKEYALTSGRELEVFIPFMNGMSPVEVIEVMNRETARTDGFIKLKVKVPGRDLPVPKTLKPGDPISIPTEAGYETFKVADSLFVDYANRGGAFAVKIK